MSSGTPVAVINGIGRFGAVKLAELLVVNDIEVVGIGEYVDELKGLNNFSWLGGAEDWVKVAEYYFDFENNSELWTKAENDGAKLVVMGINRSVEVTSELRDLRLNWRVVNVHGVYGPGMETGVEGVGEINYLAEAIKLAVANKNLILPSRKELIRLLPEADLTEVAMRSCFLSGTEKEVFEIWGDIVSLEDLAKTLIDEAKMTRYKVEESPNSNPPVGGQTPNKEEVENEWRRLRWRPRENWAEGIKETLQAYFVKADEEGRKPKIKSLSPAKAGASPFEEREINKKRFEVEVEEEMVEESPKPKVSPEGTRFAAQSLNEKINRLEVEEKPERLEEIVKEETEEVGEFEEIVPIIVKNSNARPVQNDESDNLQSSILIEEKKVHEKVEMEKEVKKEIIQKKIDIKNKTDWMKWGWRLMAIIWGFVAIVMVIWVVTTMVTFRSVNEIKSLIADKKYNEAETLIQKTKARIQSQESGVESWGWNQWVWGRRYQETLKILDQGMVLADKAVSLSKRSELLSQAVFEDKEVDWQKELSGLKTDLMETEDIMGMIEARLSGDWRWVPGRWADNVSELKNQLATARTLVDRGAKLVDVLPEIIGTDGKRREFMVLLQNENELRATGGFIGSYGILSFEGGRLLNFEIKDVYEADGQLKGHVEPPGPIKDYLGEAGWYMRDANWQADFPTAAKDIQWFLDKETGRKIDGVIGINLAVAKAMLGVVGEVYVPDFKEKVNKDNLYEQAEFYSETNSFAGSDQKASFLGGVGKQLFESIKGLKGEGKLELATAVINSLDKNEMIMEFNDPGAATVVADLGWDGSIYQGKCTTKACFADYLYIVESNLGVNKVNYFLYRNVDETVDISSQTVGRVVKISYENTAKSASWPGGDYKNYLRVYVPETANVAEVSVTDPVSGQKTVFGDNNLKINQVQGKKEIGFLVVVPKGQKRVVELRYVDQVDMTVAAKFSYINYVQKQPGFGDTGLVSLVSIPSGWQVNQAEPAASLVNGKLLFNQKLDRNIKMGIEIAK